MSHSELVGGAGPQTESLGSRLGRLFSPTRTTAEEPEETVEFIPPNVASEEDAAWTPRFTMTWRGYDRAEVDAYIEALEEDLAAARAAHTTEHAVQEEIERISNDTAEILRVAHEKADAISTRAHAQADLMIAEAQSQAEATTRDAEARARRLDADADMIWRERTRLIEDTRKLADCMLSVADDAVERFPPETSDPQPVAQPESVEPVPPGPPAVPPEPAAPEAPAPEPPPEAPPPGLA
jgi:DivIVA domain-containing protein